MFDLPKPQEKLAMLKRIALFASCTEEQLQLVVERSRLVEYKKSEPVYREGDRAEAFYIVASGRLQVFSMVEGQKRLIAVLHNGDTFGEISLLTGEPHSATIEALNDTLVLELEKQDFDELINRIPSLVLYLSRLLSKRLRTKNQLSGTGEATIVAIYGAAKGVGRTLFAVTLATALRQETGREVLLIDVNPSSEANGLCNAPPRGPILPATLRHLWADDSLQQEILDHPLGFHLLSAGELATGPDGDALVAPLVSGLAQRYGYILMDLPVEVGPLVLKALTQADIMYLVTDCARDNVTRTNALIRQVREAVNFRDDQMKVVLNMLECAGEPLSPSEIASSMEHPTSFVLPRIDIPSGEPTTWEDLQRLFERRESAYVNRVRRIARELGGVLVGLALGSGAALGLAHIGVLKIIEREKIPIDIVAGSSIGALIGALWASGHSAEDLERLALRFQSPWSVRRLFIFDFSLSIFSLIPGILAGIAMGLLAGLWAGLFFGFIVCFLLGLVMGPLIGGPIQGAQLMARLEADFEGKTFEDTWLPIKIIAANPMTREEMVLDSGLLAEAVRASVSIPGIFKPVTLMGKLCLDGGVVNPIPVSVLKQAGASRIIAVNVFPTTPELMAHQQAVQRRRLEWDAQLAARSLPVRLLARVRQELVRCFTPLVFDIIMRSMQAMEYQIAEHASREADVTLRPSLPDSHWLEFSHPEKFIRRGEEEALRHLPKLRRLVGSSDASALTTPNRPGTIHA